jgi:hypothetical protein
MKQSFFVATGVMVVLAANAAAQTITVVGTGDPTLDVPAVQAAVDQGGRVVLQGHFSFDAHPTVPETFGGISAGLIPPLSMILVSKAVVISGIRDDQGVMTTIEGGTSPFYVAAPGAHVTIQGLHFLHAKFDVITVLAAHGLVIASNRIQGVERPDPTAGVLAISVFGNAAALAGSGGQAEDVSGALSIANNDIDLEAAADGRAVLAIAIVGVGKSPDQEADLYISGNNIRNSSERPIEIYSVGGRAYIERNVITTTGDAGINVTPSGDVMHIVGPGSFLIAHNTINCQWTSGQQAAIRLQTRPDQPVSNAIVIDNDVNMSAPGGTKFSATSAAIEIRGAGDGNIVANNRIRGRANFALSVANQNGTPQNTAFMMNDLSGFTSAQADVFVDAGGMNTIAVGAQSTVEDHGSGTLIVPVR